MMFKKLALCVTSVLAVYQVTDAMPGMPFSMDGQQKKEKFPIQGDDTLGALFTHDQLAAACCVGDRDILEHFLENYPEHLAFPYGDAYPLSLAALSYIRGEPINGIMPSIEGFKILVEEDSIKKDFKIPVDFGVMDFDEYILQDAQYPDDAGKQQRLIDIQKILVKNLSKNRLNQLDKVAKLKKEKKLKLAKIRTTNSNKRNKIIAFAAGVVAVVGLSWLYSKSKTKNKAATTIA